jgi:hypothetical protein
VVNFKSDLAELDEEALEAGLPPPRVAKSGYRMWHAMLSSEECGIGARKRARVDAFKNKNYFPMGQTIEQYKAAANQLKADFEILPKSEQKGEYALEKSLLEKMPEAISIEVKNYKKIMDDREARDKPPKWTYKQLGELLAIDLAAASINNVHSQKYMGGNKFCLNCGSKDHNTTEKDANGRFVCKQKCGTCKAPFCPGGRSGVECVVCKSPFPPNSEVLNAKDEPIADHLYEKLKAWKCPATATVKMVSITTSTDDDDDESIASISTSMLSYT